MSIDNLAVRWTSEETRILQEHIDSTDYDLLAQLLPGRSKSSIRAKQKRLIKSDPIPANMKGGIMKYYLEGESEGQILQRLIKAGYNYTLKDIGTTINRIRKDLETAYMSIHNTKPTLDQLREFVKNKNG